MAGGYSSGLSAHAFFKVTKNALVGIEVIPLLLDPLTIGFDFLMSPPAFLVFLESLDDSLNLLMPA